MTIIFFGASHENGEISGLFDASVQSEKYPIVFINFNNDLTVKNKVYISDYSSYTQPIGILVNSDNTNTSLLFEGQNGHNNLDIVLDRRKME